MRDVVTWDAWLSAHPYLRPAADLLAVVERAVDAAAPPTVGAPPLDGYREEFDRGVPLLQSTRAAIDLWPVQPAILNVVQAVGSSAEAAGLADDARSLAAALDSDSDSLSVAQIGLLRFFSWKVLARALGAVVVEFSAWRDEERWLRNYCPLCGAAPAMAQLAGKDPGRLRLLSCGSCRTRWRFRRTGCPFCDSQDEHRLAAITVAGESGLRLDHCETCLGYIKTYDGEGSESVLLADWTSLHLDLLARDRGLKRRGASLYELALVEPSHAAQGTPYV
jgi:FdhE protein